MAGRNDPYRGFNFRLVWEGRAVAGFGDAPTLTDDVAEHREGGDPGGAHKSPGRTKFEAITLERGVTQDSAFNDWANSAASGDSRRDIILEMCGEAGRRAATWRVRRCWVSKWVARRGDEAGAVAIELIRLENEGWERDTSSPKSL